MAFTSSNQLLPWDPLRPLKSSPCAACGRAGATNKCGACNFAKYCNEDCQRMAWPNHKGLCVHGYAGYIGQVEKRQHKVGKLINLGGDNDGVIAHYREGLDAARHFGDAEGVRYLLRVLAHRTADAADASAYNVEADKLEAILGKPISAKHLFNHIAGGADGGSRGGGSGGGGGGNEGEPTIERLEKIVLQQRAAHQPRGAKRGLEPWCTWTQSIQDMSLTVPLPPETKRKQISVSFRRQGLLIKLEGGLVVADVVLNDTIRPDECTWTLSDGTLSVLLEKEERNVWDWLLLNPPSPPPAPPPKAKPPEAASAPTAPAPSPPSTASLDNNLEAKVEAALADLKAAVGPQDVSDPSDEVVAARASAALGEMKPDKKVREAAMARAALGKAALGKAPEPPIETLMEAAAIADLAPPRPPPMEKKA